MPITDDNEVFNTPLLSGKRLGDATESDLSADASLIEEMEALKHKLGRMSFSKVLQDFPYAALRLAEYEVRCEIVDSSEPVLKAMGVKTQAQAFAKIGVGQNF